MNAFLKKASLLLLCLVCLTGRAEIPIIESISKIIWGTEESGGATSVFLSTNWINEAKAAVPTNYVTKELSFGALTNLLCQESRRENRAAQGLWGFALIVQGHSDEDVSSGMRLLRESGESGYVPAMLNLGYLLEGNRFVARDYHEAFHWFSLAADNTNAEGQLQLGGLYHYGLGTRPDEAMAAKLYRLSAEQGDYLAMKSLGYLLMTGQGVDTNLDEAKYWFTRSAKEGNNRRAMCNLGALCLMKSPDSNSVAEGLHWYLQSAELGDALACLEMADAYYNGWGVMETNIDKYRYWRARAAALGSTEAQTRMGDACRIGDGVPKDSKLSVQWYQKAAAKNDPRALFNIALYYLGQTNEASSDMANDYMTLAAKGGHREAQFQCAMNHFTGKGAPTDFEKGKEWLLKSAQAGWGRAEFYLFHLLYNGAPPAPGCPPYPQDKVEAVKWIRRAADHGNLQAQPVLAVMLIKGEDIQQDRVEAEKLLRNAAERGYAQAQNDLGFAIQNGNTSKQDFVEAAVWCQLAEAGAMESRFQQLATDNFSNASSHLSPEEQAEVARRVKEFHPIPVAQVDPMPPGWEQNPGYQREDGNFGH